MPTLLEVTRSSDTRIRREVVGQMLDYAANPDAFWLAAKTNIQAGPIRLIFVADEIPAELQRIVEFINGQMDPAEVYAIAIPQYVGRDASGNEMKTLVPTVIGRTAEAEGKKSVSRGPGRQWDEEAFFAGLTDGADVARALQAWARETGLARIVFGKGKDVGAMAFPRTPSAPRCGRWTTGTSRGSSRGPRG